MTASFTPDEVRTALGSDLLSEVPGSAPMFDSVTNDSRIAQAGQLFVALRTEDRDGHAFAADALSRGVAGMILEQGHEVAHNLLLSPRERSSPALRPSKGEGGRWV